MRDRPPAEPPIWPTIPVSPPRGRVDLATDYAAAIGAIAAFAAFVSARWCWRRLRGR